PEAVEGAAIRDQHRALGFEHLEDSLLLLIGMGAGLRVCHAAIEQIPIELGVALELQTRREEPLPNHADLVLHLSLLPAGRRRARLRTRARAAPPRRGSASGARVAVGDRSPPVVD